jgi:hypothetical protein
MKSSSIRVLIVKLDAGGNVTRRRLFRAIGATALAKMERAWREEVRSRSYKPPEIVEYARQFGIALRKYGKADFHSVRRSSKAIKLFHSADTCFERAMDYLIDVVSTKPDLRLWLDRDVDVNSLDFGYHPEGMPYPTWSKSPHARKGAMPKRTIRDFKREALEEALERLEKRARRKSEPLPELTMIVRSKSLERLQSHDFSGWKF